MINRFFLVFGFIISIGALINFAQSPEKSYVSRNKESLRGIRKVKLFVDYILPGTEKLSKNLQLSLLRRNA